MVYRTVRPDEMLQHGIHMRLGDMTVARIAGLCGSPEQQAGIHAAVNNCNTTVVLPFPPRIPGPDIAAFQVEAGGQVIGRF
ncbi:hypothetical protein D3C76_1711730 [compost metagenome]